MPTRLLPALFAFVVSIAPAQDIRGTISGAVTDPQGTNIAHAIAVVTSYGTLLLRLCLGRPTK